MTVHTFHVQPIHNNDYYALAVTTPFSQAQISLLGAQVISFSPKGAEEMLWISQSLKKPPSPVRGGIPVCWPYFSREGQTENVPFHGLARSVVWRLVEQRPTASQTILLEFVPPHFDHLPVQLRMQLEIGKTLKQSLITTNKGTSPYVLTQALHTYFKVADVEKIYVTGVDKCPFLDKFQGAKETHIQQGNWTLNDAHNPGHSDRIYTKGGGIYDIVDPLMHRRIRIQTHGSEGLVIWNPGQEGAAKLDDIAHQWKEFVCVETTNAGPDKITVGPQQEHVLSHILSLEPLSTELSE